MNKVFLIGNPNVGKSVVFSRLTGLKVISSNYPGTTVEVTKGYMKAEKEEYEIIDLPGMYSFDYSSDAEKITADILNKAVLENKNSGKITIVNIVDSTNLERNLNLTMQLLKMRIPTVIVLNFSDEAKHLGISIDAGKMKHLLGVDIIPACAVTGEGIKELTEKIKTASPGYYEFKEENRWTEIGRIVSETQKLQHRHHTVWDRLGEITIKPLTGIPFSLTVLYLIFRIVRFIGESLINYILDPIFNNYYYPVVIKIADKLFHPKFIYDFLIGGKIMETFGVLTTGIYIPFVIVLPYILSFYLILSILEDIGYLPRLAVLFDSVLHKLGVHGYSGIPIILGLGCKVPAICATRILESSREKIIATALILMMAPCMPQTAMIVSLIAPFGSYYLFLIFGLLFTVAVVISLVLNKVLKGEIPELFLEIPPYRIPRISALVTKLWIRLKDFFLEAVPLIVAGITAINILEFIGVLKFITGLSRIFFVNVLGLPKDVMSVVIMGFLRKDVAIALLAPFNLNAKQLVIASVFMVLYLPCIATFFILIKEMGLKNTVKIVLIMLFSAVAVSGLLNLFL